MSPILPENVSRYPSYWPELSLRIRRRAGWRCEGSPEYPDCRAENGKPHPDTGSIVVLTVAHLDYDDKSLELSNPERLRVWCQRCHLNYDRHIHTANARRAKERRSGQLRLL